MNAMTQAVMQQTMQAIVRTEYGEADVLRVGEAVRPTIGPGEVLVKVRAAALDRGTWHQMTGTPFLFRMMIGLRAPKDPVIGLDVAGTIVEVGAEVTQLKVGDEVFGFSKGSFAQYACARADKLARKPAGLTFEQAAVSGVSALTALQALRDVGQVQAGQRVLIIGASGGVGTYAVQLAKAYGAEVTGVCSTSKLELVRSLGANHVIDYTSQDYATGAQRYDLIIDIAGNSALSRLRRVLSQKGTIVFVGGEGGGALTGGMNRQLWAAFLSMFTRQRFAMKMPNEKGADLEVVAQFIEAGKVKPVIDRTVTLQQVPDAMRQLVAGKVAGKIAITVA